MCDGAQRISVPTKLMDRSQHSPVSRSEGLPAYTGLICPIINCLDFQYNREEVCEERESEAIPEFSRLSEMDSSSRSSPSLLEIPKANEHSGLW